MQVKTGGELDYFLHWVVRVCVCARVCACEDSCVHGVCEHLHV